jgi:hypothetical protein
VKVRRVIWARRVLTLIGAPPKDQPAVETALYQHGISRLPYRPADPGHEAIPPIG